MPKKNIKKGDPYQWQVEQSVNKIIEKLNINNLEMINNIATDGLKPDLTFILDLNPAKAGERMGSEAPDRMETIGTEFFKKVREGYRQIVEQNPDRCIEINAEQTPDNVYKEIYQIILKRFEKELICS